MERFQRVYRQGVIEVTEIWVDTETGVNYVFHKDGNAAGFTPLLDKRGSRSSHSNKFHKSPAAHLASLIPRRLPGSRFSQKRRINEQNILYRRFPLRREKYNC